MRHLSDILVKHDYTTQKKPSSYFYKDSPAWQKLLAFGCIFLLAFAGLGEWRVLNGRLGGLPKAVTVGVICIAIAYAFIYPDLKRLRSLIPPTLAYMFLMAALFLWSIVIWIMEFMNLSSMIRGCSKLAFQSISILTAVSLVYLFGAKAVDIFTLSICFSNGAIMLLEVPNYGVAASIRSLITCLVTFGDAEGYARQLEIHDLTFVFGQLFLYYVSFAPHDTFPEKKRRWFFILASGFFFLVGMKRIAIPAVVLFIVVGWFFQKRNTPKWFYPLIGVIWTVFFLVFVYGVKMGYVSKLLNTFGIDMMGREYMWYLASSHFDFSLFYVGHGFEYVDTLVGQWFQAGLIKAALAFHNDILKVFVEMGFPGFLLWSGIQYIACPIFWQKYADQKTTLLYMCELSYMSFTYLTDNTSFYFWSTMALRLVALAYSVERKKPPKPQVWKPKNKQEMHDHIRILMQENQS